MTVDRRLAPPALAAAAVLWLSLSDGGFFPQSWGWPTLVFLLVVAGFVVGADHVALPRLDRLLLTALGCFVCWSALSALWASGAELPIQSAELALLYVGAVAAFLLLGSPSLPVGVLAAVVPVAVYSLATRLVPDDVGTYQPQSGGYLLAGPTGYHNCLGMLCSIATLIGLGVVAYSHRTARRCAAAIALVVLLPTLYFTFSRGAVAVLGLGLLITAALDPRRLRFATTALVTLPLPLFLVWVCSRSGPLTRAGAPLESAARDGHRLAIFLCLAGALQVGVVVLVGKLERRVTSAPRMRRACVAVVACLGATVTAGALVRVGDPIAFVSRATDQFREASPEAAANLNDRLLTASSDSRSKYWAVAWREVSDKPLLGGGGETFRRYWLEYRRASSGVLNTHNLYLETLAELGPVGLLLLVVALGVPLTAAVTARHQPMVPVIAGAYTASLVHAAIDWDWQLPALTCGTLALGASLVIAARAPRLATHVTPAARVVGVFSLLALLVFVFAAQLGNNAEAAAQNASRRNDVHGELANARSAERWLPWAGQPRRLVGEALMAEGDVAAARVSFRKAVALERADWQAWRALGMTSAGAKRQRDLVAATRLNPIGMAGAVRRR